MKLGGKGTIRKALAAVVVTVLTLQFGVPAIAKAFVVFSG